MKEMLSIDVGSVSISLLHMDLEGHLLGARYLLHRGDPAGALAPLLPSYDPKNLAGIAAPSGKAAFLPSVRRYDLQVSLMEAVKYMDEKPQSILHVGAERFFLMELDGERYVQTSHSSSCAAGTGSFLDQQALRLNLEDAAQLSTLALRNTDQLPSIAARCSVFAKTDLIHAQQKGFGLEAICDSLCKGLADNVHHTLFNKSDYRQPLLMSGGVACNAAVHRHLEHSLGHPILVPEHARHLPALGAARLFLKDLSAGRLDTGISSLEVFAPPTPKVFHHEPLCAGESSPGAPVIALQPARCGHSAMVEVDHFSSLAADGAYYLGMDVGSTSTKAVLLSREGRAVRGYYTYTLGQPLKAGQALLEAMEHDVQGRPDSLRILACGTTGSGRKFMGSLVGADLVVDEITAHARAAYALNPLTDTIIEIGGQDAKFTRMRDGNVSFSHMNTVCAAGTGSFLEELSGRMGVDLSEYENRAMGRKAPLASDRCTVFMERDINHLLSQGYEVDEVLATMIHSVRENYLKKVASEAQLGQHICFQGATAKNRALVAAFEQKLGRSIFVSPLCHLTGALGTALLLKEEFKGQSQFSGFDLLSGEVELHTERCELCLNHCTISVAGIQGSTRAYGFLCGRDYDSPRLLNRDGTGLDYLAWWKGRLKAVPRADQGALKAPEVGLPACLHLVDDHLFWSLFFSQLGIGVKSSLPCRNSLERGKLAAGAEFCAPVASMYGHLNYLDEKCAYIFMPVYLQGRRCGPGKEENYCYYTQFSASLAHSLDAKLQAKLLSPMLDFKKGDVHNAGLLAKSLRKLGLDPGTRAICHALSVAREEDEHFRKEGQGLLARKLGRKREVPAVVLLGRPYVLMTEALNKGIPDLFRNMEVESYFQEMLDLQKEGDPALEELLSKIPWHYAARILRAAEQVCRTSGLYPVLVTAFKCAPDAFILSYFEHLLHAHGKPYLIIQIDEHDSNTGYETRIEAALRSFANHLVRENQGSGSKPVHRRLGNLLPRVETKIGDRILLLPNWDMDVSPLIAANLRRAGYDARLLESSEMAIRRSMVHNTGQCLPASIIAQDYMDYMATHHLDPSQCILWMMESKMTCNLRQYPFYIKQILEKHGQGMEKAAVYSGELTHRELPLTVSYYAYFAYMLGGLFRKVACRIRPYEHEKGQTDRVFAMVKQELISAISGKQRIDAAVTQGLRKFSKIGFDQEARKPLVAIFGDFYVRDNEVMNQGLVADIEAAGGEVLLTPYHEFTQMSMENIFRRAHDRGEHLKTHVNRALLNVLKFMDDRIYRQFSPLLGDPPTIHPRLLEKDLAKYGVDLMQSGESYDNLLKIIYLTRHYPISLFVQTNPSFCCPALVTEAMTRKIKEITGIPVLTLTYDGTSDYRNDAVVPYLRDGLRRMAPER